MERVYAFTDEYGNPGWDFSKEGVSTHFIITAIIVKESDLDFLRLEVEKVRKKHFQTGEMKSIKVKTHDRRKRIILDLLKLPFNIFSVVIDKQQLTDSRGLKFKPSFYKFMNNIVHKELRHAFTKLTVVADEIGGSDYMKSFSKYVENNQEVPNLFGESEFMFQNSKSDVLIQLADMISGTIARNFDVQKKSNDVPDFIKLLEKKIIRIELYPKTYETYIIKNSALAGDYDEDIANICFKQAVDYINLHENDEDSEAQAQIIVLKYLLFRFMNSDTRDYIPTKELKNQLLNTELADVPIQSFRTKIIGKLRDNGVIISGSGVKKGYKIPAKESELFDFINHGTTIIMPMLNRLKICRDLIKLGTNNRLDLFENTEYSSLRKYFDN